MNKFNWQDVPIFGSLARCKVSDHLEAAQEFLWTIFLAALPIFGSLLIFSIADFGETKTVGWRLELFASNGDLLILGAAMIAPILYLVQKDFSSTEERVTRFYHRNAFSFCFVAILLTASILYAVLELQKYSEVGIKLRGSISEVSYFILFLAVVLTYLCYVYRNAIGGTSARDLISGENALEKEFKAFRKTNPELGTSTPPTGSLSGVDPPKIETSSGGESEQ